MNAYTRQATVALAAGLGVFIALAGAATLVGMPWQYQSEGLLLTLGRVLGALLAVVVGLATAWLAIRD